MDIMVKLRNKKTGAISNVPAKLWDEKQYLPEWKGVFVVVETISEPPEVTALKARQEQKK